MKKILSLILLLLLSGIQSGFMKPQKPQAPSNIFLFAGSDVRQLVTYKKAKNFPCSKPVIDRLKIDHLIESVKKSPHTFIREGRSYTGKLAAEHLMRKYRFAFDKIKTPGDFIHYVASASSLTGQPYYLKDKDGHTYVAREILINELTRFEETLKQDGICR